MRTEVAPDIVQQSNSTSLNAYSHPLDMLAVQVCEVSEVDTHFLHELSFLHERMFWRHTLSCQKATGLCFCLVPGNIIIWLVEKKHILPQIRISIAHWMSHFCCCAWCLSVCVSVQQNLSDMQHCDSDWQCVCVLCADKMDKIPFLLLSLSVSPSFLLSLSLSHSCCTPNCTRLKFF